MGVSLTGLFQQAVVVHGEQLSDDWRHRRRVLVPTGQRVTSSGDVIVHRRIVTRATLCYNSPLAVCLSQVGVVAKRLDGSC